MNNAIHNIELEEGWVQLHSGRKFVLLDPQPENITIKDLAHSLSHLCRFNGHIREFYSVGQHSILVSQAVEPRFALAGLLHDASEALITDIPKPLKRLSIFAGYRELEAKIQHMIFTKFGVEGEPPEVKMADMQMLSTEARDLLAPLHPDWKLSIDPLPFTIVPLSPTETEALFLHTFRQLVSPEAYHKWMNE